MAQDTQLESGATPSKPRIFSDAELGFGTNSVTTASSSAPKVLTDAELGFAPQAPSLARSVGDSAIALGTGVAQGVKMVSDAFGADNAVSRLMGKGIQAAEGLESDYRKAEKQARARKIKDAEDSGSTWEEVKAYAGSFADAPLDTTLNAVGSVVPTLAAAALTGGGSAAAQLAARAAPMAIGAVQGAGAVKGGIYEAVEQRHLEAGATPEQAAARASAAQAYDGDNLGSIATGAGLGVLAGSTGAEAAVRRLASVGAAKQVADASAVGIAKGAAVGAAKEAPMEAVQGGQERLAANLAEQGEGFDTPTMRGVLGQAALEGMAAAPLGGGLGAVEASGRAGRADHAAARQNAEVAAQDAQAKTDAMVADAQLQAQERARVLAEQEVDAPDVPQTTPPDGAAALRAQQEAAAAARQQELEASRAVQESDDEILQSTGQAEPVRPSEAMGLRADAGVLESAAAMAVDSGLTQQLQAEATAQQSAAEQKQEQSAQDHQGINTETGEVSDAAREEQIRERLDFLGQQGRAQGWSAEAVAQRDALQHELDLLSPGQRIEQLNAQADAAAAEAADWVGRQYKPNPKELPEHAAQGGPADVGEANEQRRLKRLVQAKGKEASARAQADALQEQGNAAAQLAAKHDMAALRRKKTDELSTEELQALAADLGPRHVRAKRLQKVIAQRKAQAQPAINQGVNDRGPQTDQAQQASAQQPAAGAAAVQAVNGVPAATAAQAAGPAAKQGAVNGGATTGNNGPQASQQGAAGSQEAIAAIAQEGNARREAERTRKLEASERWTRMSTVDRQAAAINAKGLNAIQKKNVHTKPWADLSEKVRASLLEVVAPVAATENKAFNARVKASSATNSVESLESKAAVATKSNRLSAWDEATQDDNAVALNRVQELVDSGRMGLDEANAMVERAIRASTIAGDKGIVADYLGEAVARKTGAAYDYASTIDQFDGLEGMSLKDARAEHAKRMAARDAQTNAPAIEAAAAARTVVIAKPVEKKTTAAKIKAASAADTKDLGGNQSEIVDSTAKNATKSVSVVGKDIDAEWAEFSKESGTKGIPRAQMPQIKAVHRGAMTNFMNARGVKHEEQEVAADTLKPTQAEFSKEKVARAKDAPPTDRSVLVSKDGFVLDGHHQWMAALEKGEQVKVIRLDADIDQLLTLAHEFPSSTVAEGSPKTSQEQSGQALAAIKSEPVPAPKATAATRIDDVGEKIGGARKDLWAEFKDDLRAVPDDQIQAQPLSKVWPQTDYQKLIEAGHDPAVVALVRSMRDAVPVKPRQSHKVKRWAEQVQLLRSLAMEMLDGKLAQQKLREQLRVMGSRDVLGVLGRAELYEAMGHSKSLEGITFGEHHYSLYRGRENVNLWVVEQAAKATAFSNWPREIATGDTKQAALQAFKQAYGQLGEVQQKKTASFDIISETYTRNYYVGKKLGRNYAKLAGPFKTVKEARAHRDANEEALTKQLQAYKLVPQERADENRPRVGQDMRNGVDVTPEQFRDTFGFRGVEFGNWVEQGKRQKELNDAYDALMDLAAVLQLPAKAMSLNGELGMAFGARGTGGVGAFKANYEPGKVVINLTKRSGAGSLGHEWWHAVDNYFSRMRKSADGFMTSSRDVLQQAKGSQVVPSGEGVRLEMVQAFGGVMRAIHSTALRDRSAKLDERRSKDYWSTDVELSARAFEGYLLAKLQDQDASNDYLVNVVSPKVWETAAQAGVKLDNAYPYPSIEEMPVIRAGFDRLFEVMESKETDKGVALFRASGVFAASQEAGTAGLSLEQAQKAVKEALAGLGSAPPVNVVGRSAELGISAPDGVMGAMIPSEGRIVLVASAHTSDLEVVETLFHEMFHLGLRNVLPSSDYVQVMLDLAKRDARVQRYAIDWKKNAPDAPLQLQALRERGYVGSELTAQYEALAIEEGLAVVAQELAARKLPGTALTLRVRQLAGWFAGVAQRMGMSRLAASIRKLTYNDAERFVMTAIDAAGRGTDARASMDAMYRTQGSGERSEGGAMRGLDLAQAMKVLEQSQAGMSAQMIAQVNKVVDGIRKTWVNAPEVVVAYGMEDAKIPKEALATDSLQRSEGAEGDPEGFYWEGKVYLLADMLHTPNDVARVFFHEALGHHGLRGVFGKQLDGVLEQITVMRKADVAAKLTQYGLQNTPKGRRVAAEEVLAEMAQATPEIGFVKRALAAVRTWLRANVPGFKSLQLSDAEIIRDYILPARAWVERGGSDGNGPRGGQRIEPAMSRAEAGSTTDQTQTANFKRWYGDWQNATQGVPNNDSINLDARGERALNTVQREGSVGANPDGATRVGDFTFPGASGPVGRDGAPARLFHGTRDDITAFDRGAASRKDNGWLGAGFYFTSEPFIADLYSGAKQGAVGRNTMPVYVAVRNPYVASHAEKAEMKHWTRERLEQHTQALIEQGYDGVVLEGDGGVIELVAFEPTQVKSAIGNNGDFDPANPDIRFSRAKMAELKDKGLQMAHTYMSHPGKVSLWDKTVGTMRHVAERYPAFKPVFEAAQQFIDDVSSIANEAAQYAPRLIPRVETVRDMLKKPISVVDNKAIGKALFGGNLDWGRDQHGKAMPIDELKAKYAGLTVDQKAEVLLAAKKVDPQMMAAMRGKQLEQFESFINNRFDSTILKAGVAFNHKELRDFFGMNEQQISLYDEARATVDKSLDITARAEMLRALGRDWDGFRDMVMDAPTLTDAWKLLDDELEQRAKAIPDSRDQMAAKMFQIRASHDKARELMDSGYMPLQRFGKYTVDVVGADGERIYFGMFESKAESNRMAETMRREYPDATVTQGTVNEDKYKLFAGITPETAELFGTMLGLDAAGNDAKDQAFQEFLKLSKNNHSALKRLIHRKGIAGYSEDVGRVLASFVYSNARLAATGLNAGKMENAINELNTTHKQEGELGEIAAKLREYIQDPQEEGQAIRGMLFAQYLGGSIASAMVNMTQPFAVTLPWLSQFGGMAKASKYMSAALKDMTQSALKKGFSYEPDLAHALKMAEDDGTVSPQEIHQLMAQSRGAGGLRTGDGTKTGDARAAASNAWEKGKVAWGQPFALAEQFNRRSTFIAAYRIARDRGMDNPAQFARRAVVETQFLYTKANKPQWARGAIGGTLFTFKTYSVSFLELMQRTWNAGEAGSPERAAGRRAVGWAMLMLMLMGGAGGLPFVEDVEDLVDGAGQMMGYNFSLKQERKQFMTKMLGAELADFMESGLSGLPGMPLDVSGRLGMDNLIPGTGLALNKQSSTRDIVEMMGPAGDLVSRAFSGAGDMLAGLFTADAARMGRGAMEAMPTAVRNAVKGADMAASGMYKDSKGYKVIDTTLDEAILKAIGFQPRSVAEVQESNSFMQRSKSFYIQTSSDIKAKWAQALFDKDAAGVERARERVQEWNRKNPDQPIRINMPDIWKRVAQMGKDRTDRIADTAPKALRQQLRSMAQEQSR